MSHHSLLRLPPQDSEVGRVAAVVGALEVQVGGGGGDLMS